MCTISFVNLIYVCLKTSAITNVSAAACNSYQKLLPYSSIQKLSLIITVHAITPVNVTTKWTFSLPENPWSTKTDANIDTGICTHYSRYSPAFVSLQHPPEGHYSSHTKADIRIRHGIFNDSPISFVAHAREACLCKANLHVQ